MQFKGVTNRFSAAYRSSGRIFVKGYLGCLETSLHGLTTRFLRIRPRAGASAFHRWSLNELYVFEAVESKDRQLSLPEKDTIEDAIRNRNLDFVFADRAQSSRINQEVRSRGQSPAFRRYNPKFPDSLISREVIPGRGKAILVDRRYARECKALLEQTYGREILAEQLKLGMCELLVLDSGERPDDKPTLFWNGHTLVKVDCAPPRWH
jgi:hypothetical protein